MLFLIVTIAFPLSSHALKSDLEAAHVTQLVFYLQYIIELGNHRRWIWASSPCLSSSATPSGPSGNEGPRPCQISRLILVDWLTQSRMNYGTLIVNVDHTAFSPWIEFSPVHALMLYSKIRYRSSQVWCPVICDKARVWTTHQALADRIDAVVWILLALFDEATVPFPTSML